MDSKIAVMQKRKDINEKKNTTEQRDIDLNLFYCS
jgi:hypothetical protein